MNLVLIGSPGSGKTTVGKLLSERLKTDFVDTDERIQTLFGDISMIIEIMGREKFRRCEKEVVKVESTRKNAVIATGGGVVLDEENVSLLKGGGKLFYLRASEETLYERLKETDDRPLLRGNMRKKLGELMRERSALYEGAADVIIEASGTAEETAKRIEGIWRKEGWAERS